MFSNVIVWCKSLALAEFFLVSSTLQPTMAARLGARSLYELSGNERRHERELLFQLSRMCEYPTIHMLITVSLEIKVVAYHLHMSFICFQYSD